MRTITVRLPDEAYEAVKQYADDDRMSMNSWVEQLLDREDMRRRCSQHERWMSRDPHARELAEHIADQAANEVASR